MIRLNAPKGLGDAIYVRAVALHLLRCGEQVKVYTRWPEVFADLGIEVDTLSHIDIRAPEVDVRNVTACLHCQVPAILSLDKFTLACLQAGISEPVELRLDWTVKDTCLLADIRNRAGSRPIMLYQPLRKSKNTAQELMSPRAAPFREYLVGARNVFRVKIGHPDFTRDDDLPCELDLFGKITIAQDIRYRDYQRHILWRGLLSPSNRAGS